MYVHVHVYVYVYVFDVFVWCVCVCVCACVLACENVRWKKPPPFEPLVTPRLKARLGV